MKNVFFYSPEKELLAQLFYRIHKSEEKNKQILKTYLQKKISKTKCVQKDLFLKTSFMISRLNVQKSASPNFFFDKAYTLKEQKSSQNFSFSRQSNQKKIPFILDISKNRSWTSFSTKSKTSLKKRLFLFQNKKQVQLVLLLLLLNQYLIPFYNTNSRLEKTEVVNKNSWAEISKFPVEHFPSVLPKLITASLTLTNSNSFSKKTISPFLQSDLCSKKQPGFLKSSFLIPLDKPDLRNFVSLSVDKLRLSRSLSTGVEKLRPAKLISDFFFKFKGYDIISTYPLKNFFGFDFIEKIGMDLTYKMGLSLKKFDLLSKQFNPPIFVGSKEIPKFPFFTSTLNFNLYNPKKDQTKIQINLSLFLIQNILAFFFNKPLGKFITFAKIFPDIFLKITSKNFYLLSYLKELNYKTFKTFFFLKVFIEKKGLFCLKSLKLKKKKLFSFLKKMTEKRGFVKNTEHFFFRVLWNSQFLKQIFHKGSTVISKQFLEDFPGFFFGSFFYSQMIHQFSILVSKEKNRLHYYLTFCKNTFSKILSSFCVFLFNPQKKLFFRPTVETKFQEFDLLNLVCPIFDPTKNSKKLLSTNSNFFLIVSSFGQIYRTFSWAPFFFSQRKIFLEWTGNKKLFFPHDLIKIDIPLNGLSFLFGSNFLKQPLGKTDRSFTTSVDKFRLSTGFSTSFLSKAIFREMRQTETRNFLTLSENFLPKKFKNGVEYLSSSIFLIKNHRWNFYRLTFSFLKKKNSETRAWVSKSTVKIYLFQLKKVIRDNIAQTQECLMEKLSKQILKGSSLFNMPWNKNLFKYYDFILLKQLWRWCSRRHPKKSRRWILKKYFLTNFLVDSFYSFSEKPFLLKIRSPFFGMYEKTENCLKILPFHSIFYFLPPKTILQKQLSKESKWYICLSNDLF
jgi:hypothetical protein